MPPLNRFVALSAASLLALGTVLLAQSDTKSKASPKRPQVSLKATPPSGMVPVHVIGVAELKGGDDDFEEYYCPTVAWDWDDGTVSESTNDCDPYESGKSQIRRKYTVSHAYKESGHYRISFRLKQKQKVVGGATAVIQLLGAGGF